MWAQQWRRTIQVSFCSIFGYGEKFIISHLSVSDQDSNSFCYVIFPVILCLQQIASVETSLLLKGPTLVLWEERLLWEQTSFEFAFLKETFTTMIWAYHLINVRDGLIGMSWKPWLALITKFLGDKDLSLTEERIFTAVKHYQSVENR